MTHLPLFSKKTVIALSNTLLTFSPVLDEHSENKNLI